MILPAESVISIIPLISIICFAVSVLYPMYKTLLLLYSIQHPDKPCVSSLKNCDLKSFYVHWVSYWLLFALFRVLETYVLCFVIPYWPLYLEMKTVAFLWLGHLEFQGAGWLWYTFLDTRYGPVDEMITHAFITYCPPYVRKLLESKQQTQAGSAEATSTTHKGFETARDISETVGVDSLPPAKKS